MSLMTSHVLSFVAWVAISVMEYSTFFGASAMVLVEALRDDVCSCGALSFVWFVCLAVDVLPLQGADEP